MSGQCIKYIPLAVLFSKVCLFLIEILHPRPNRALVVERPRLNNPGKSGVSRGRRGDKYTIPIPPSVRQCLHPRMMHSWYLFEVSCSGKFKGGANESPFGLDLVQRSTGDRVNEPPFLCEELRNLLLWLTPACLSKDLDQKRID